MIPSFNLKGTVSFFRDELDFSSVLDTETYAVYQKDNLTIHILRASEDIGQMDVMGTVQSETCTVQFEMCTMDFEMCTVDF